MFMRAVHPGRVLRDELEEFGMTPTEFARQIAVPANRIARIVAGKRSTTGDTALRLGHWFGADPQFWLNLQSQRDLAQAHKAAGAAIRRLNRDQIAASHPVGEFARLGAAVGHAFALQGEGEAVVEWPSSSSRISLCSS